MFLYVFHCYRSSNSERLAMTNYEINSFELTPEFEACWLAAGRHLNLRVRDAGASWLRADLPPFREHLSFALGNQLFFIQIVDVEARSNGWFQEDRLALAVQDANGIGCIMPMKCVEGGWEPIALGWGLIDWKTQAPINPFALVTDELILMTPWEIHDVGVQAVRRHLVTNGWTIASWQSDLQVDPSIFAHKDGVMCGFVVRNANKGPEKGKRPENASQIAELMRARGWGAKFVGMKVAADYDPENPQNFDPASVYPELQHLTRRIKRRSRLLLSLVDVEELVP
jgi:hypothetical protein